MKRVTVKDVVLQRRLGSLELGRSRDDIEQKYGEPATVGVANRSLVTYENVEVQYQDSVLEFFKVYLTRDGGFPLENLLEVTEVTLDEARGWIDEASPDSATEPALNEFGGFLLALSNGVTLIFQDEVLEELNFESKTESEFLFFSGQLEG